MMYRLLFRQFLRTQACQLGLLLGLFVGIASLFVGQQFLKKQDRIALEVEEKQQEHIERNIKYHGDDLGLLLYYLKFSIVNDQEPIAALSIGQKDLNPTVQSVNIMTLEGQRYDTDLVNPNKLLYGNLDLGFVIIYIFPLLIIAFTYNLRSEEEETGTWKMVSVMTRSNLKFLLSKLLVRFTPLAILMIVLFALAGWFLKIPFASQLFPFFVISFFYLLFWFSLSFWVVSLKLSSNFNSLLLLTTWLGLVVLIPSMVNSYVANRFPMPEAFTTIINQRDGYHTKWDIEKRGTVEEFYEDYPQLAHYGFPTEEGFTWHWYYAMQHLGDVESSEQSRLMVQKIEQRDAVSKELAWFIPSMHVQLIFNDIAGTSLNHHLRFLKYIKSFHEDIRLYFYPKVFEKLTAESIDWKRFEPFHFKGEKRSFDWSKTLLPLFIGIIVFIGLSAFGARQSFSEI